MCRKLTSSCRRHGDRLLHVVGLAAVWLLHAFSADAGLWQTNIVAGQFHLVRLPVSQLLVRIWSMGLLSQNMGDVLPKHKVHASVQTISVPGNTGHVGMACDQLSNRPHRLCTDWLKSTSSVSLLGNTAGNL